MYSKIKRLRRRGERKADREIGADPGIVGHIVGADATLTHGADFG